MHRYLAFVWNYADADSSGPVALIESALLSAASWEIAYKSRGLLVIHRPARQRYASFHSFANHQGVVLGTLFQKGTKDTIPQPVGDFSESETRQIVESRGSHLVQHYWGSYVAFAQEPSSKSCSLLRDPTANLACYHATWKTIHVFFSDMDDLTRYVPISLSVNWRYMAAHLVAGLSHSRECALSEVEDIPGGEWTTLSPSTATRTTAWHPAHFCIKDRLEDEQAALDELRSTILGAVCALASQHENIVVLLSGGLDSSIVTSCLSQRNRELHVTCMNFYIAGDGAVPPAPRDTPGLSREDLAKLRRIVSSADEREFARNVAATCGFGLIEAGRPVSDLDFTRMCNGPLVPRPSAYAYNLDVDAAQSQVSEATGATACFSGQGGDSVLYATQRAIGALDYAYLHPLGRRLIQEVFSSATLSRESLLRVFAKAVRHGYCRVPLPEPFDLLTRPHLLRDDVVVGSIDSPFIHPWIASCPRLCPGKHAHVLGIANSVPQYHLIYHRERTTPSINPLASQPVVECCLRIPTYVLLTGATSRGLARRAFQDILPAEVFRRTTKGIGTGYYQNLVRRNMPAIKACLIDGELTRQHLLDREKLESYLAPGQPFLTVQAAQILDYLACETWLTQVTARSAEQREHARML